MLNCLLQRPSRTPSTPSPSPLAGLPYAGSGCADCTCYFLQNMEPECLLALVFPGKDSQIFVHSIGSLTTAGFSSLAFSAMRERVRASMSLEAWLVFSNFPIVKG